MFMSSRINKIIKIILQIFLLNIIPIIIILIGIYGITKINDKIDKINLQINNNLNNKKLSDIKKENENLKKEYNLYAKNDVEYISKMKKIKKEIKDEEKNKEKNELKINQTTEKLNNLKEENKKKLEEFKKISNYKINSVITYNQYPKYPTGCEAVSLYILLKYYNLNINIEDVMNSMPKGNIPYKKNDKMYGGNPNYEFLGNPRNNNGWGIYDKGLAITANKYKSGIINGTGSDFKKIYSIIRQNRPVIVWTSINLINPYNGLSWYTENTNEKITWKNYNHAVVVIGYNENSIIISDPIDGKIKYMNKERFIRIYNFMGRRVIYY